MTSVEWQHGQVTSNSVRSFVIGASNLECCVYDKSTVPDPPAHGATHRVADVRVVTYNIHRCRGLDRRTRPERIANVLSAIEPDIVALQEVVGAGVTPGHAEALGAALAMGWVMTPARLWRSHAF